MAPRHDGIVRQLGDGWSIAWDTTEVDESTHRAIDKVIARQSDAFKAIMSEGLEETEIEGSARSSAADGARPGITGRSRRKAAA
jgi:hypothetical protein